MLTQYEKIYQRMTEEIGKARRHSTTDLQRAQNCYHIACSYWNLVKQDSRNIVFENTKEEIHFFRNIKPSFTSQIEFYIILSEALIALSKDDPAKFWQSELKRPDRFYQKKESFIQYYESGRRDQDHQHFIRSRKYPGILANTRIYDLGPGLYSHYGQLLSSWLAWKLYSNEVQARLAEL